jgi:putative ABC transport system permease protein
MKGDFNIILRRIKRQKLNNSVIVISLTIGMTCISLISIFLKKELSTDRFHKNNDRIYALTCDNPWIQGEKMYDCFYHSVDFVTHNFPQIEEYCLASHFGVSSLTINNTKIEDVAFLLKATENFFRFFNFKLINGNASSVLSSTNNVVVSENFAKTYFGTTDVVGKTISYVEAHEMVDKTISGVFEKPKENSHLDFEIVSEASEIDSKWGQGKCYFLLSKNTNPDELLLNINKNIDKAPVFPGLKGFYHLIPLIKIYFDRDRNVYRDIKDLWLAAGIGLIILILSLLNSFGIINNKLNADTKDYAIKRINGGTQKNFILFYFKEHLILITIAFALSFLLLLLIVPYFNSITKSALNVQYFLNPKQLIIMAFPPLIILAIIVSFISTRIYSLKLFNPGTFTIKALKSPTSTPAFNIFQIACSIVLIISSFVILKQISFVTNKDIGLDKNVIQVAIHPDCLNQGTAFKQELLKSTAIKQVSRSNHHFTFCSLSMNFLNDYSSGKNTQYAYSFLSADGDIVKTLGIDVIRGESFSGEYSDINNCIINESFAKLFPSIDLLGKELPGDGRIVKGIVRNFNYQSLKSFVEPVVIYAENNNKNQILFIKPSDNQTSKAISEIKNIWSKLSPDKPLTIIDTIGESYNLIHQNDKNFSELIISFGLISIFLSMIGLFSLSYHDSFKRTKEIGIRKVNGAKISEVLIMLNKDFVKWVAFSFIIATPIAYYAMHKWLENFAYKTELSWWIFALAGLLALGIALLTVSWQSWRAATRNPVEALRYE